MTGIKLRCINSPNPKVLAGRVYEVAEILELPAHVMVRKPNGKWPRPGECYFGMHPEEYLEQPPAGIPAFSCGFDYVDREFFGVIIPNSILPVSPDWNPKKPSTLRAIDRFLAVVEEVGRKGLWPLTYRNVLTKDNYDNLESAFTVLGIDYRDLAGRTARQTAAKAIQRVMHKLGIPPSSMPPVQEQQLEFWHRSWRKPGPLTWRSPKWVSGQQLIVV